MQILLTIYIWILMISCIHGKYIREKVVQKKSRDMHAFFNQVESMMNGMWGNSKLQKFSLSDLRKQRYTVPERNVVDQMEAIRSLNIPVVNSNKDTYYSDDTQRRNNALDFEGYQDDVFRPLYRCDRFDAARRYCVLFRQLGATLTLGVQTPEGLRRGMHIRWSRFLKKKQYDHYIIEPLNKDYLPWNLNLGGSENELRISPITETDLSYNYFVAELIETRPYRGRKERKVTIRFSIEPIHIDMGSLYHGEEIIVYARSFMELPQSSITFLWSIYDSNDFGDHGLPSNMRLNSDRSSVIIKELKTYQNQILICSVYSNKNVFLARRNFLFGASANKNDVFERRKLKRNRYKRSYDSSGLSYDGSSEEQQSPGEDNLLITESDDSTPSNIASETLSLFQQVRIPEISQDLFYDSERHEYVSPKDQSYSRLPRLRRAPKFYSDQDEMLHARLRPLPLEESVVTKASEFEEPPPIEDYVLMNVRQQVEDLRFEDRESLTIATCSSNFDCNIHAVCSRASSSGQKFCKCSHGYNGNGVFCFSN